MVGRFEFNLIGHDRWHRGGSALTTIIVSGQNSTTSGNGNSSLSLAGHNANVQAASLAIGENIGNTANGANGTVTFDTGVFNTGSVTIGAYLSGSSTTCANRFANYWRR